MIQVEHLSKSFQIRKRQAGLKSSLRSFFVAKSENIQALDDLSFTIETGEIVGMIGPNGAGKSTTIKILSGILVPDSGTCTVLQYCPWKSRKEYVKKIGVVLGQRSQLFWDVPVEDTYGLLKDLYDLSPHEYLDSLQELIQMLSLKELLPVPVRQLSLGQRMRCEIAAALLHRPQILFLDEPTIGLDAISKTAVRRFIRELNQRRSTTVILTTHDMKDIESLSTRILLVGKGKLLLDGSLEELRHRFGHIKEVSFRTAEPIILPKGAKILEQTEYRTRLRLDLKSCSLNQLLLQLSQNGGIEDLAVEENSIEEIVAQLYQQYNII